MSIVTATLLRWCIAIMLGLLALIVGPLMDSDLDRWPSDAQVEAEVEADLAEAISQAQAERPDLWDADARARAHVAIAIAARHAAADR